MKIYTTLLLLFFLNTIYTQPLAKTYTQELANAESMKYGSLTVCAMDIKTGEMLLQYNSNKALTPASIMKLTTTYTAMSVLGGDFQFKTELQYDGTITSDGTLRGNIYIKGSGDPTLGSPEMETALSMEGVLAKFVAAIKAKGIKKIEGAIIGDATHFAEAMPVASWQWNDLGNYYAAGASGLNFHENLYYLYFQQNQTLGGTPEIAEITPKQPYLVFKNEIINDKKGTGDNAYIFGAPYTYNRTIRGTIPVGNGKFDIKGSIPDPAFFAAFSLLEALENAGIETNKQAKNYYEVLREGKNIAGSRKSLTTILSPKLREIAKEANEESINLYCEALLKTLGKQLKGEGSTEKGVEAVTEFWEGKGVNMDGFFMDDGSGLSPRNAFSAFQLANMLRVASNDANYQDFYNSLAIGGRTGTVKYMFKKTIAEGKIRIKSGSMRRVRSYAGYLTTKSGKEVAFVMIANNFTGKSYLIRNKMQKIMVGIYDL